ncbi:MAG: ribulokinase [Bacteroidetes bacterium]|nr:ribulokinase [Bacteroidota bacterium]
MSEKYVIGVDYGTDSCRALILNAYSGEEIGSSVKNYPRWMEGKYCDSLKDRYRQHPLDYIEVLEYVVNDALSACPADVAGNVVGMAFDTTGSTPVLTDENGTPLALKSGFEENPNAMFILWKDHTSVKEAAEINELARKWETDYTRYEGGIYSSEWVWAKVLHVLREDEEVRKAAYSWVEHCDWMPALLTGNTKPEDIRRSRCAAGHKAMWHESWGLPDEEFLVALDSLLKGFRSRLYHKTYTSDIVVGTLTEEWAEKLGLTVNVKVGVGAFDAHLGAVGGEVSPKALLRIMGTSTCDIITASYREMENKLVPGICGQVDGSVVPGYIGMEAGQSAFGDVYAWFKNLLSWPLSLLENEEKAKELEEQILPKLTEEAAKIPIAESAVLATDWINGRRTPDANPMVKGTITGITLGTSAPMIFRALVEATAFGSKAIIDRFIENGIEIKEVIALGGVARKSDLVMQILSDVLNMPIKIVRSEQACALGAAMFAAVNAGIYKKVEEAQKALGQGFEKEFTPNPGKHKKYINIYEKYLNLGEITEKLMIKQNLSDV